MATKFDKVVRREVCRVTTKGTQTFSFLDGDATEAKSNFLLGIAEKEDSSEGCSTYGVCFVDTSIKREFHASILPVYSYEQYSQGYFLPVVTFTHALSKHDSIKKTPFPGVGQFTDDRYSSRLRTLIAHYTPVQFKTHGLAGGFETHGVTGEFKTHGVTGEIKTCGVAGEFETHGVTGDSLGLTAADEYNLAVRALGSVTWYLQFCLLDTDLLTMKNFEEYTPLDDNVVKARSTVFTGKQHMVLDGVTLANLDVTENSSNGTLEGTLLQRLDQCSTPFGRRLLKQWLCAPLCNPESINDRLNGVEDLMESQDIVAEVIEMMKKIPDLEKEY
ncbi:MSH6 [Mytilus edulis]|uniref:MSH6 n=1 Tax=Mytilus edulis TaxID=6550 RepID=A0A8S3TV66_MYTED|nr:MSH6 [Mytilus edulis]